MKQKTRSANSAMASRCWSHTGAYRRMVASLDAWQHGLGNVARHIPGPFVEQGVVLHYQEGVVVLFQDGPELDGGEGPPHYQLDRAAVQPAEDAGTDASDKENPELLR